MKRLPALALALLAATSPTALLAQDAGAPDADGGAPAGDVTADAADEEEAVEVVVTGQREPGAVIGDIEPEIRLDPADIRAYGVGSVAELLEALGPQVGSARGRGEGRPIVLLDGRRIGGFGEIRDLPTEAILRVDILPEEVALSYGYRADQRVVNIVLRPRFRSYNAELEFGGPTAGGSSEFEVEAGVVRITRGERTNIDAEYERSSNLLESERDIIAAAPRNPFDLTGNITATDGGEIDPAFSAAAGSPVTVIGLPSGGITGAPGFATLLPGAGTANVTDTTPFRTLRPASDRASLNAVIARNLFGTQPVTVSLRAERTSSEALLGLPGVGIVVPGTNPFSPFADDVVISRFAGTNPLMRRSTGLETEASISANGDFSGSWRWSLSGNYTRTQNDSETDRGVDVAGLQAAVLAGDPSVNPFAPLTGGLPLLVDTARSVSNNAQVNGVVNGELFQLPAGAVRTTVRVGLSSLGQDSRSVRGGVPVETEIGRQRANGQLSVDLPVASRGRYVLSALGDLSLNANAEVEQLSDFGTLTTLGYGVRWSPFDPLQLIVSMNHEDGAPSPGQLANPLIATPNVRVFDFVRGETVDITRLDGGNPNLIADNRRVFSVNARLRPIEDTDLALSVDYTDTRIDDPIASFPAATAAVEAAFPDRFVRDATGRLLQIDNRAVNFDRSERRQIRWGINFSKPIESTLPRRIAAMREAGTLPAGTFGGGGFGGRGGFGGGRGRGGGGGAAAPAPAPAPVPEAGAAAAGGTPAAAPPAADGQTPPPAADAPPQRGPGARGGGGRGGGRGFGGRGGGGGGRLQFNAYHTILLADRIFIREGLPVLDLLDGGATGSSGGQSRHRVELQSGWSRDGIGARLSANWRSGTRVDGGVAGTESLEFSSLATFDLRLWADLGNQPELVARSPFLRGTRVSLRLDNIFDARQRVTDANGLVPLSYQPGYLDPVGRRVMISFRKLFLPSFREIREERRRERES